jgi:hypothetical protein
VQAVDRRPVRGTINAARARPIDEFMPKIEELVDRSKGRIRADVAHRKIAAMGYRGRSGPRAMRSRG